MGLFNNVALLYICVLIASMFYNPALIVGETPVVDSIMGFFSVGIDADNDVYLQEHAFANLTDDATSRLLEEGRSVDKDNNPLQSFLMLIDTTWNAIKFIELFFRFLFAPVVILSALSAPSYITFTLGVPFVFLGLLSIIMIIRGYA